MAAPFPFNAVDTEATGLYARKGDRAYGFSICNHLGNTDNWMFDVDPYTRKPLITNGDKKQILERLTDGTPLVFHNAQFDCEILKATIGFEPDWSLIHDTGALSHLHNSHIHASLYGRLKSLALQYVNVFDDDEQELRKATSSARLMHNKLKLGWKLSIKGKTTKDHIAPDYWVPRAIAQHTDLPEDHPWHTLCETYMGTDTWRTALLFHFLYERVNDKYADLYERERKLMGVIWRMRQRGIGIKPKLIKTEIKRYGDQCSSSLKEMTRLAKVKEFNPESPLQLRSVLFDNLKFKPVKLTPSGLISTDKDVLDVLMTQGKTTRQKKFINAMKMFRGGNTAMKYLHAYDISQVNGFLFPSLNQWGTGTVRFSSSDPNGQNVGKGKDLEEGEKPEYNLRTVFGPRPGRCWLCIDYSQLQLRLFAYISKEPDLIQAFEDGYDAHSYIACRIFDKRPEDITKLERRIGKNVNFCFIFGGSARKLDTTAGIEGLWDTVSDMFPNAHRYMAKTKAQVRRTGMVHTPSGYPLYLPVYDGSVASHAGVNYEVQGCEGDIVKQAMVNVDEVVQVHTSSRFNPHLIFQVHDELIIDIPDYRDNSSLKKPVRKFVAETVKAMTKPAIMLGMKTPVDVEVTFTNWAETKPFELAS